MRDERRWNIVFALGIGLSIWFVRASIAREPLHSSYFSADHLYIPTLFADLTRWNGHFRDWNLSPAPYFFPDMLLYGFVWLFARTVEDAQYLTGWLQLVLAICAARMLLRRLEPRRSAASALVASSIVAWLVVYHFDASVLAGPVMIVSAHGGALVGMLVVFSLCLRTDQPSPLAGIAVAVISALTSLSDALFTVCSSVVLGLTALVVVPVEHRLRRNGAGPGPLRLSRCLFAAGTGIAGLVLARRTGVAHAENSSGSLALATATAHKMWGDADPLARYVLLGFAGVASVSLVTIARSLRAPDRTGLRILATWQLFVTSGVLAGMLYTGAYIDRWSLRYLSVPSFLAVVFFTALLGHALEPGPAADRPNPWAWRLIVGLSCAAVVAIATTLSSVLAASTAAPQRAAAPCVEDVARREGVDVILSDYWNAKPLMLLTDQKARVLQVRKGVVPYLWINSRGWYRAPGEFGIVIANGIDVHRTQLEFHAPQSVAHCGELELWIYRGAARAHMARRLRSAFKKALAAP